MRDSISGWYVVAPWQSIEPSVHMESIQFRSSENWKLPGSVDIENTL